MYPKLHGVWGRLAVTLFLVHFAHRKKDTSKNRMLYGKASGPSESAEGDFGLAHVSIFFFEKYTYGPEPEHVICT